MSFIKISRISVNFSKVPKLGPDHQLSPVSAHLYWNYCYIIVSYSKKVANRMWWKLAIRVVLFSLKSCFQGSVWAKIKVFNWVFRGCLNGFLIGRRMFIAWSFLSSVNFLNFFNDFINSSLLKWGEKDAVNAIRNKGESTRATTINWGS